MELRPNPLASVPVPVPVPAPAGSGSQFTPKSSSAIKRAVAKMKCKVSCGPNLKNTIMTAEQRAIQACTSQPISAIDSTSTQAMIGFQLAEGEAVDMNVGVVQVESMECSPASEDLAHRNLELVITNKRVLLVDTKTSQWSEFEEGGSADDSKVTHRIKSDMWAFAIPLHNVTGSALEFHNDVKQEVELYQTVCSKMTLILIILVILAGAGAGAYSMRDQDPIPVAVGGVVLILLAVIIWKVLVKNSFKQMPVETKAVRRISVGAKDPLVQVHRVFHFDFDQRFPVRHAALIVRALASSAGK